MSRLSRLINSNVDPHYWFDFIPLTPRTLDEIFKRSYGEVTEEELVQMLEHNMEHTIVAVFSVFKTHILN